MYLKLPLPFQFWFHLVDDCHIANPHFFVINIVYDCNQLCSVLFVSLSLLLMLLQMEALSSKIFKVVVYGWVYCRMTRQKAETAVDGVHAALETDIYVFSLLKRSKLNFLFPLTGVCNIIRCQEIKLTM